MRLNEYSAYELSAMLRDGKCCAYEVLSDTLKCAYEKQYDINAYISFNNEAELSAKNISKDMLNSDKSSLLTGIPIAVKDNISTKCIRTTCASKMLENYIPPYDAAVIEKLKASGAVIIGKTNMDEFAMGSASDTGIYGAVKNPHHNSFSAGGSSGGSAAAVASGGAVLALGSDTGGSVRQPASFCGMVGFCPSYGAVSRYGLIAFSSSMDRIGSFGRSVADTYLLHNTINGKDLRDVTSFDKFFSFDLKGDLKGVRIGVVKEFFENTDNDVNASVTAGIKLMESVGAEIRQFTMPDIRSAVNAYYIISSAEASSNLARYDGIRFGYRAENCKNLDELYKRSRSEGFGDEVKRRIMLGTFVLSEGYCDAYYKRAASVRRKLCAEFDEIFEECDIIASPVYPKTVIGFADGSITKTQLYSADVCTVPSSLAGLPAISVPCGRSSEGIPIGLQLIGKRFYDDKVFDIAYGFERERGGSDV